MGSVRSVTRWGCICIIALALGSGCYGKSVLSSGVSKWHSDLKWNKYSKEALFVPIFMLVLPVTSIVDYFILNSIDYWTTEGDPLAADAAPGKEGSSGPIARSEAGSAPWRMTIDPSRSVLQDESGRPVTELRPAEDGSLVLTDLNTGAKRRITPAEIESLPR
jgi:hypothetical protein